MSIVTPLLISQLCDPTPDPDLPMIELVGLDWQQRQRSRQRMFTDHGTEIILTLPRGTHLHHGDILYQDAQRRIQVNALPEAVVRIRSQPLPLMCKAAHQLGNWHRSLQILEDGSLLAQADQPLQDWLTHVGIRFDCLEHPFHPNVASHAH